VPLRAADGSLDVALDGKPYPLRLVFKDAGNSADLHFGQYDAPMSAPQRPTDVIDAPTRPAA
jgi:hypothetical protein